MSCALSLANPLFATLSEAAETTDHRDVELMRLIAQGEESAMRELIERHQSRVIGTISRMLGPDGDAEDLAQQAFIRIWKSAGRYQPSAKFTTWMFTIVRNLVFNETRRKKNQHLSGELDPEYHDASQRAPDAEALETEKMLAIERAISELPEAQRMAVVLRRYEDVPYEEMARILGQTVPGVKSLLFRARTTLRESLRKYLD